MSPCISAATNTDHPQKLVDIQKNVNTAFKFCLINFILLFPSKTPENIKKTEVFGCFKGVQKGNTGLAWFNPFSRQCPISIPPENLRKPKVQKWEIGVKWVNTMYAAFINVIITIITITIDHFHTTFLFILVSQSSATIEINWSKMK